MWRSSSSIPNGSGESCRKARGDSFRTKANPDSLLEHHEAADASILGPNSNPRGQTDIESEQPKRLRNQQIVETEGWRRVSDSGVVGSAACEVAELLASGNLILTVVVNQMPLSEGAVSSRWI
ncbi:hypothetical protein Nepgr_022912 [Nepenthes gracilis]|uniref:Uncharacterized protein n=1 Tax=Nepenthes gracilis TaxID=150966 RepID=A0AAD3T1I7_NEPGR|nr:hypothetical protein Nepgr_022912 [Nepenthes gracilis]